MQITEPVLATGIDTTPDALIITLADKRISIPWDKCSPAMAAATDEQRRCAELSPGGYGVHWPLIDEDLSIGGLVRAVVEGGYHRIADKDHKLQRIIDTLESCESLLIKHAKQFIDAVGYQETDPPAIILKRAVDFAQQTISSIRVLLSQNGGEKNAILACTLCRTVYEIATRLLWASLTPQGWERLQTYYAKENKKWAEKSQQFQGTKDVAMRLLGQANEVLARKDEHGNNFRVAPDMKGLLEGIVTQNHRIGLTQLDPKDLGGYEYVNVYQWLCRPVHGHPSAIGTPEYWLSFLRPCIILATWLLLQASCHMGANDPKDEIERIGEKIRAML